MAEYERRPEGERSGSSSNTAIVAIVVIILLAVVAFFVFLRPGTDAMEPQNEPDIELEVEPPATEDVPGLDEGGDAGGDEGGGNDAGDGNVL